MHTRCFYLRRSMQVYMSILSFLLLLHGNKRLFHAFRGQKGTGTWVIEAIEFKYEVRSDLRGHMEATVTSEATKMAVAGNMHIDARVIEVACVKYNVKLDLKGH